MKKHLGVLIFCSSASAFAQSVTPQVVATSGDYYTGSAATLSWTLGEIAADTYIGTGNQLTQGFQQPEIRFSGIEDLAPSVLMVAYPNPTAAEINLEIKDNEEMLALILSDAAGNVVLSDTYSGSSVQKIDLSAFADGLYLLQVSSPSRGLLKTIKIQKN